MAFSLALGLVLIWLIVKDLTEQDKINIIASFKKANYWWVGASMMVALLSHYFRAYRWKYTLDALDMKVSMPNRFFSVMAGYLFNLAFPRLGEVTRCALITRYDKHPFEKVFGTVIAERFIDALILLTITFITIVTQIDVLQDWITSNLGQKFQDITNGWFLALIAVIGLVIAFVGWRFLQTSDHYLALKFRDKVTGLLQGFASIKNMKGQFWFYFHTAMIWFCYTLMHVLNFQSFDETAALPLGAILASFTLGGLTIVAVQGGLGAYPLAIMAILILYGVTKDLGYAFGWIAWTSQTLLVVVVGFASIILMPIFNRKSEAANG